MMYTEVWSEIEQKAQEIRAKAIRQRICLREGQALFNATAVLYPDLASRLTGKPCDCFYSDMNIPEFAVAVMSEFGYDATASEST